MVNGQIQKKSFQLSLEDIKEKMKEKRNKRLAGASAPNRGRSKNKASVVQSASTILLGVQQNNKTLALALQAEKQKLSQANTVIMQLKSERHALYLHLIMLKRKLEERKSEPSKTKPPNTLVEPEHHVDAPGRKQTSQIVDKPSVVSASPICTDHDFPVEFHHSTPEPVPPKDNNKPRLSRKRAKQQPCPKPEPAAQKPERGRKPDRAPLKKPWENPKPRARSKCRDQPATRAKTACLSQGNKHNNSLGFNDTFDFDCEEAVHVTPFKAKAEDNHSSTPVREPTPQTEALPVFFKPDESSSSSSLSESEVSLYVPEKTTQRQTSLDKCNGITTRRGRVSKIIRQKENVPSQQETSVFMDEGSSPKAVDPEMEEAHPDCSFSNSPDPAILRQENTHVPLTGVSKKDCLLPVGPLVEEEVKRINNVLSNFGDSSGEGAPLLPHKIRKSVNTCKNRKLGVRKARRDLSLCDVTNMSPAAYRLVSCGGSQIANARSSTSVPARKRRCTMVLDYKEPPLNVKLRRGDKFTDVKFLRSPIFKQKSGRRSVQKSRKSINGQLRNASGHLLD
ncbi:hypothetical protein PBY51_005252 [Eleginops maclovinus]|uniref:Shugoshin C-terminal domain-containing protein n=1 Tax=Eleginops maclovinus TaxID=56733 RepID=A0AAN8AHE1_ELEMC|nr:hypothetical protein PBY51_005252 [Eleginops maclovinus]